MRLRLVARIRELGLSNEELAARLGVSDRTVTRWRSGRTTPPESIQPLLAKLLEVNEDTLDLLLDSGKMRRPQEIAAQLRKLRQETPEAEAIAALEWVLERRPTP